MDELIVVPEAINLNILPSLPLTEKRLLPEVPAIYFAIDSQEIVQYIGRSANLRQRWAGHHRYRHLRDIKGLRLVWLEVSDVSLLPGIEEALINSFNPPFNTKRAKNTCFAAKSQKPGRACQKIIAPVSKAIRRVKSRLAVLMAERDPRMSQREVAEKSGVSVMAVNRLYRNDFKRVDAETIEKLCDFFRCDLPDLLVLKDESK